MAIGLALFQPEIPQNAGALIRLGACFDATIHIIHPTGFHFSDTRLRRAGMDYIDSAQIREHDSFTVFDAWRISNNHRLVLLSSKAAASAYEAEFEANDILLVGRESSGVPGYVADAADLSIRIPMAKGLRSINVALAAALMVGEAKRQTDQFKELE